MSRLTDALWVVAGIVDGAWRAATRGLRDRLGLD